MKTERAKRKRKYKELAAARKKVLKLAAELDDAEQNVRNILFEIDYLEGAL